MGAAGRSSGLERDRGRRRAAGPGPRGAPVPPPRRGGHRARGRAHREPERGRRLDRAPLPGPRRASTGSAPTSTPSSRPPLRGAPAVRRGRRRGRARHRRGRGPGRCGEPPAPGRLPGDGDARLRRDRPQPGHHPRPARESHRRGQRHPEPRHPHDRRVEYARDGRVLLPDLGAGAPDPGRALAPAPLADRPRLAGDPRGRGGRRQHGGPGVRLQAARVRRFRRSRGDGGQRVRGVAGVRVPGELHHPADRHPLRHARGIRRGGDAGHRPGRGGAHDPARSGCGTTESTGCCSSAGSSCW